MANWKFTDQYGATYPALANSILSTLVFDVSSGTSPVNPDTGAFSAPLDLGATGLAMNVLATLTGMTTIPMNGTVSTADNTLTVTLSSTNDTEITAAIAACIPLIGGSITQNAGIAINNITPASLTADDDPEKDEIDLSITIKIGNGTGTLKTQIPMSSGIFAVNAEFENFGISLSDLNFLATGTPFSSLFPTTLPNSYYNPSSTSLNLLSLGLTLLVQTKPKLSVSVSSVSVSIGIVNIPLYNNALFLNPLAVWIVVSNPTSNPTATWGLEATLALYPYATQTNPPSAKPDFLFEIGMQMPGSDPTFSISGQFENTDSLPVSTMLCDLMSDASFDTGIAKNITVDKLDFYTAADTSSGTITEFSIDIGMSSPFGLFLTPGFGVKDFSISVSYSS